MRIRILRLLIVTAVFLPVFLITVSCSKNSSNENSTGVDFNKMPKFSPEGGFYKEAQTVTVSSTVEGGIIYYTLDGSTPSEESAQYSAPISLSANCVLRAVVVAGKEKHSAMTAFNFDTTTDVSSHLASPDWSNEIVYLAMTDRFSDGDSDNNKQGCSEVEDDPAQEMSFSGGDFQGLIDKLNDGYFTALGITSIWVTPPIKNQWYEGNYGGYHGYWASDFTQVDPHLGDIAKYREFVALAHSKGIRVIQDIVLNHVGDYFTIDNKPFTFGSGNWSLNDVSKPFAAPEQFPWNMNNPEILSREELLYSSFYHWAPAISDFNDISQIYSYQQGNLDDLNTDNAVVANLLRGYFRYWIDKVDVDGYRIDTVKYIKPEFFEGFANATDAGNLGIREYAKSLGKNDFILFGEAWSESDSLCASYTQSASGSARMDSMIYFPLNIAIRDVFASGSKTSTLTTVMNRRYNSGYAFPDKLVTFVDNHDMARMRSVTTDSLNKASYAFIMTIPGIPQIYYGTEQNFTTCRRAMFAGGYQGSNMPVNDADSFSTSGDMFTFLKNIIALRRNSSVFTKGSVSVLKDSSVGKGIFAYKLVEEQGVSGKEAFVIFNTSSESKAASNIATGFAPGSVFSLQNPSVGVTQEDFTVDKNGMISLIIPAESFGIFKLTSVGTVPSDPANTVSITSSYSAPITSGALTVSGTVLTAPAEVLIIFDGNIDSAQTLSIADGESTVWSKTILVNSLGSGTHTVVAALSNGDSYLFSNEVSFVITPVLTLSGSVVDAKGDDTGPAGYSYTLPKNSTFATHLEDILKVEVYTSVPDMEIKITMRDTSKVWAPTVNDFDHVLFNIFLRKADSSSTVTALPLYHYNIPFAWDFMIKEEGWNAAMYNSSGAGAAANGSSVSPAPKSVVDHVNHTITFKISGSSIGNPTSLSGWQVYIATWDADMGNPRGLTADGASYSFGGGDGSVDPLVIDEIVPITLQ